MLLFINVQLLHLPIHPGFLNTAVQHMLPSMQADHPGQSPHSILALPGMHKPGKARRSAVRFLVIVKTVRTQLYRTIPWYRVHFYASWQELAPYFSTDVALDRGNQPAFGCGLAAPVMVKFDVFGNQRSKNIELAVIIGIKKQAVEPGDGIVQQWVGRCIGWQAFRYFASGSGTGVKQGA